MKILHLFHHSDLVNGVDRSTLTLLRALHERGEEVFAVVPRVGDVTAALDELGTAYRVADLGCCAGTAKSAEFSYLGRAAARAAEIEALILEKGIDLVHLNTGHLLDAAIAAARTGTACVWHIHSPFEEDFKRYASFLTPEAYAWLLEELGSQVIAVSEDIRASLLGHLSADKVSTLHNGVNIEDLERRSHHGTGDLRADLGLSPETPIVIGVGRISAQKNFAAFIGTAHRVIQQHREVCFAIVGPAEDKSLAERLQNQVLELGMERRVFIMGARHDVPALLTQSDLFLSTAIFEGHPIAALEAMTLRLPVIAMACIGLRECIQSEVDGLLSPLGDEAACAVNVLRVLDDRSFAGKLGVRAHQTVAKHYSASAYAQKFLEISHRARSNPDQHRKAAAASFAHGLLNEIRELNERLAQTRREPAGFGTLLRTRLRFLTRKRT